MTDIGNWNIEQVLIENIAVLIVLALFGYEDIRYRSISMIRLVIVIAVAGVYRCFNLETDIYTVATGLAIMAGMIMYCRLTGNIGAADIVVMAFLGLMKGVMFAVASSMCGIVLASLSMIVMMLARKVSGNKEIPFVPFLGLGTLGVMICV